MQSEIHDQTSYDKQLGPPPKAALLLSSILAFALTTGVGAWVYAANRENTLKSQRMKTNCSQQRGGWFNTVTGGDDMIGVPETTNAGPEPATGNAPLAALSADERAELVWGDEALTMHRDVSVTANEGPRARP